MTKAELREELLGIIKEKEQEIKELKEKVELTERYEGLEAAAREIKMGQDAFIAAGFTEKQAFAMTQEIVKAGLRNAC